jgi:hypothetical protein
MGLVRAPRSCDAPEPVMPVPNDFLDALPRARSAESSDRAGASTSGGPPEPSVRLVEAIRIAREGAARPPSPWGPVAVLASIALTSVRPQGLWAAGVAVVVVVVVRDLGYLLGMRAFHVHDPRSLAFPSLARFGGEGERDAPTLARGLALLAGPGFGVFVGALLVAFAQGPLSRAFGNLLVEVNALYLLPSLFLDGGRFMQLVIPDRWLGWEAGARGFLAAIGVVVAICLRSVWGGALAVSVGLGVPFAAAMGRAIVFLRPRWPSLAPAIEEAPIAFFVDADTELEAQFGKQQPSTLARQIGMVHARLATRPLASRHLALLLGLYVASLVVAAVCIFALPR